MSEANIKLLESLHCFHILTREVRSLSRALSDIIENDQPKQINETYVITYITVFNTVILKSRCFLDEYEKHFTAERIPSFRKRLDELKEICTPVINEIENTWPYLKSYRNQFISHGYRDSKDNYIFDKTLLHGIPGKVYELQGLDTYLAMITEVIRLEFPNEYDQAISQFERPSVQSISRPSPDQLIYTTLLLVGEVNARCKSLGKDYRLKP